MVQGGNARCHLPRSVLSANITHASPTRKMLPTLKIWALLSVSLCCLSQPGHLKKGFRCPSTCSCSKESIICVGSSYVPRISPNEINSLSIVNGTFTEVKEAMFSHMPSLQLLLLNSNSLTTIRDDAFTGLSHLEYLFIESNKIETASKYAFRGLRDLTHLSLANNNIKALPRDLFNDLDSLIELDLRGNAFECDCRAKWLMMWLKNTNATVSDVMCVGPEDLKDKRLNDMTSLHNECISTDFVLHQSVASESLSVDTFSYKDDVYVAIAAPSIESCMVFQWDHIEMNFRTYDNITGQSIVGCKSVVIQNQVFVIVAQLFGGSHIYRFDEDQSRFSKFQDIEVSKISKPNDIEAFQIGSDSFFVIADSSKAGLSTLYKWNDKGFYSYQSLHEWYRDTDAEFLDLDGKAHLILASRSQVPVIYQWSRNNQKFVLQGEIPNMEDVVAVKHFRIKGELYLAMTRYIGDSKVLHWGAKQFAEIQALPSRGSMILQPFYFKERYYLALGSDYTFSQIYLWDDENKLFDRFKEVYIQAPRSFTVVSTDRRDFIFASSFKGNTQIFEHIIIDLSL
ncbi:leucine-rich repeat LGI family member 2-like isoform X1 [Seriola lalandi dorsalis]|uniref:Leucine-rich repeat LGI family, member 2a n=1 Tax=Seriola lalandi dorsalis TaxID=1841481 RepID=A0A3B4WN27_SERLL|nr:leucine-rich repeat LGI family member 2-like isoform X1 [Seriola lalandi dorsalis]XP_056225763.1 leucine-rich repeat LGI family member 2a [Seriola aureovittata]